jgi:hypothetical protein
LHFEIDFRVTGHAQTAKQALELAFLRRADVILVDFPVPGLNDLESFVNLCGCAPEASLVVVGAADRLKAISKTITRPLAAVLKETRETLHLPDSTEIRIPEWDVITDAIRNVSPNLNITKRLVYGPSHEIARELQVDPYVINRIVYALFQCGLVEAHPSEDGGYWTAITDKGDILAMRSDYLEIGLSSLEMKVLRTTRRWAAQPD